MNVKQYLEESLNGTDDSLCKGWDYLKKNITPELQRIIDDSRYWELSYNTQKVDFIMKKLNLTLPENLKKQLGSFVYIYNDKRREDEKKNEEQNILDNGFIKITGQQKELDNKKVTGIFKMSKIGVMGSFDKLEEHTGTLKWSESYKTLFFIPKRCRTRGMVIRDFAYIKEKGDLNGNTKAN